MILVYPSYGLTILHFQVHNYLKSPAIPLFNGLLPTGSEEREVLGVGKIPAAILSSCQYMQILHYNCTDMNFSWVVKIRNTSKVVLRP